MTHDIPEQSLLVACDGRVYRRLISAQENKQPLVECSEYLSAELDNAVLAAPDLSDGP
jgi:hypothetical protein